VGLGSLLSLAVSLPGDEGAALYARVPAMLNFCAGLTVGHLLHTAKSSHIAIYNKDNLLDAQQAKVRSFFNVAHSTMR
jgi:hypothetical protein